MNTTLSEYSRKTNMMRKIARVWSLVIFAIGSTIFIAEFLAALLNPGVTGDYPWNENLIPYILILWVIGLALVWRWDHRKYSFDCLYDRHLHHVHCLWGSRQRFAGSPADINTCVGSRNSISNQLVENWSNFRSPDRITAFILREMKFLFISQFRQIDWWKTARINYCWLKPLLLLERLWWKPGSPSQFPHRPGCSEVDR